MSIYGNFALKSCNEFYAVETKDPNLLFMEFDMIAKDLKCDIFESVISITESSDDYYITEGKIWDGIKSIFGRIKDAILTALGKLKEIFQSVWAKIRGKKHKETVKAYKEEKKNEPIGSHPGKALRNPIPGTSDKQLPATVDNNKQLPATTSNDRQLPAVSGGNNNQLPAIADRKSVV